MSNTQAPAVGDTVYVYPAIVRENQSPRIGTVRAIRRKYFEVKFKDEWDTLDFSIDGWAYINNGICRKVAYADPAFRQPEIDEYRAEQDKKAAEKKAEMDERQALIADVSRLAKEIDFSFFDSYILRDMQRTFMRVSGAR